MLSCPGLAGPLLLSCSGFTGSLPPLSSGPAGSSGISSANSGSTNSFSSELFSIRFSGFSSSDSPLPSLSPVGSGTNPVTVVVMVII